MVFASVLFLLGFLPLFLIAYHITPTNKRNWTALVGSLIFYVWGAPNFFWLLITVLIANFYFVKQIQDEQKEKLRLMYMVISLALNLGVLVYFKYANFFIENLNSILLLAEIEEVSWTKVVLPIGISFFTFQSITYTLDVYWKKHEPLEKISDYLLYILLFPQLIAGPIIRFNTIATEIKNRSENDTIDYKLSGTYIFIIGLAKKALIANQIGQQVDLIFGAEEELSTIQYWLGIIAYSVQIYFDFSGYSDMAIGLGKLLGFNFPENFKSPYTSQSITEFWRRWHITLGAFMRDYLYIPLGGSRSTPLRNYINLVLVFLLSGLWHGSSWNFIIWGAWHGIFLVIERAFLLKWLNKAPSIIGLFYSYLIVLIGWVFFRTENLTNAFGYLKHLFNFQKNSLTIYNIEYDSSFYFFLVVGLLFSIITIFPLGKRLENFFFYSDFNNREHLLVSFLSFLLLIISISYICSSGFNPFIYFRF